MTTPLGIRSITVEESQKDSPLLRWLPEGVAQVIPDRPRDVDYRHGKRQLHLASKRGEAMGLCASLHPKYLCCSTHVLRAVSNCPMECSYCFLQNYLTNNTTTVVVDTEGLLEEVRRKTSLQPWRFFRIGTWELGDSLALEPIIPAASELVEAFARQIPNGVLKLRTKTASVVPLLNLDHRGHTVVSWTLSPQAIIDRDEAGTAPLAQRLEAMGRVAKAGYLVGVHLHPMILFPGWEEAYRDLVRQVFARVPPQSIPWISLGSLRFNPEMKRTLEIHYPKSQLTAAEMVLGDDNKYRYVRPLREAMYQSMVQVIEECGGAECFTYLCMERPNVWQRVFGRAPQSTGHLDYLITRSLHRRFPSLVARLPDRDRYLALLDGCDNMEPRPEVQPGPKAF